MSAVANPPKAKKISRKEAERLAAEEAKIQPLVDYFLQGKEAGCPPDQMKNFAKAGLILQPKQLQFAAYCRDCDKEDGPTCVGYGGARGAGKTFTVLAQVGADDCQRYAGLKCLFLRKVGKSNKEQFEDFRKKVFSHLEHEYKEQKAVLTFKNGSTIIVGHFSKESDIDAYLGLEYDIIVVEEATTLSHSKWKNILTCMRSSKPGWRPRAYASTNPGNIGHVWFKQIFITPLIQRREVYTRFVPATVLDNKFVNKEYVQVLESLSGWQRDAWLAGSWDFQAGQFFSNWKESVHVLPSVDERMIVRYYGALDYGFNHYTVFHLGGEDRFGNMYILETHAARQTTVDTHAKAIHGMLDKRNMRMGDLKWIVAGKDCFSKHPTGDTVAELYEREGITLQCAEMDRVNGWATVLKRLGDPDNGIAPTLFIHSRCKMLIEQIPVMQHDPHKPEDVLKVDISEDGEGGDDSVDAMRFLVNSSPETAVQFARPLNVSTYAKYRPRMA